LYDDAKSNKSLDVAAIRIRMTEMLDAILARDAVRLARAPDASLEAAFVAPCSDLSPPLPRLAEANFYPTPRRRR
jgi:hypothetical protein